MLRQAQERANIQYNGTRVYFYPHFSVEVKRSRAKFNDVKRRLWFLQLSYAMLYPPKLQVTIRGQAQFFESAKEASAWLDKWTGPKVTRPWGGGRLTHFMRSCYSELSYNPSLLLKYIFGEILSFTELLFSGWGT